MTKSMFNSNTETEILVTDPGALQKQYFIKTEHRKRITCFNLDIFLFHEEYQHLKFDSSSTYHKSRATVLLLTVCKHLGTQETSCKIFLKEMISHSCLIEDSSCSIFFMKLQMFFFNIYHMGLHIDTEHLMALLMCSQIQLK